MIYVLLLEQDKYYVGWTNNLEKRLCHHTQRTSNKPSWIKKYPFVKIVEVAEGDKTQEKEITLKYMQKYGWQNVRGASWTQSGLIRCPLELRDTQEICIID